MIFNKNKAKVIYEFNGKMYSSGTKMYAALTKASKLKVPTKQELLNINLSPEKIDAKKFLVPTKSEYKNETTINYYPDGNKVVIHPLN